MRTQRLLLALFLRRVALRRVPLRNALFCLFWGILTLSVSESVVAQSLGRDALGKSMPSASGKGAYNQGTKSLRRDSLLSELAFAEAARRNDTATVRLLCALAADIFGNNPIEAMSYARRAERLAENIGDKRGAALALEQMGFAHRVAGLYAESLEYSLRVLRIAEEMNDINIEISALNGVGQAYAGQEYFDRALAYYRRALDLTNQKGADSLRGRLLNNIGVVLRDRKEYDSALVYLFRAMPYYTKDSLTTPTISGYYAILYNIGSVYERTKDYVRAREYVRQMLDLVELRKDSTSLIYAYRGLSRIAFGEGRYSLAKELAMKALAIARSVGIRVREDETLRLLADIYGKEGDYQKELAYFKEAAAVKDSLSGATAARRSALAMGAYMADRLEAETQAKEREQTLLRNFLIAISLLFAALVVVVVNRYRLKARAEKELRQVNEEILRQQTLLEEQSRKIEEMNAELQESNLQLSEANVELDAANNEMQSYIQELHRMNAELDSQNERLQEFNREKDEFLGIAAHDLKNPLGYIRLSADMMRRFKEKMSDEEKHMRLGNIVETVDRMIRIINDLLQHNALETGGVAPNIVPVDAADLARRVEEEYRERARQKSIDLLLISSGEPFVALADVQMTFSVVENLLSNALKFSPSHSRVSVRLSRAENSVRIEIADEGPGLSEEDKSKLFGKFMRLSAQPTGGEHSTGLGLSIVKKMVEAMQGRVWCESELGKGATFIVELPIATPTTGSLAERQTGRVEE